ncbi:hypothetical protein IFO70_04270 [Phormidium tenue FACHB-886]|nr:hypothetical protein [Phormidium tenue FACHB-886]
MVHFPVQNKVFRQTQRFCSVALLSTTLLVGIAIEQAALASSPEQPQQTQLSQLPSASTQLPRRVARQVQRDAAQRFNVPRRDLQVVQFSRETWTDGCLGLAAPNERCTGALVEGWRVELTNGQQNWVYRTDLTAQMVRPEPAYPGSAVLLPELSDRLRQTVAQEQGISFASLQIADAQSATWNGCMGIFEPEQACTMIALPGWRVIMTDGDRSWVYHLTEDGSRIVQNTTASNQGLVPSFRVDEQSDSLPSEVIFRLSQTGGLTGAISERVLTADGVLYRREVVPNLGQEGERVIEKRLSPQQVKAFQQVLSEQRFPNLDRLRYISSESLADYPTTTLQAMGTTVDYTDLKLEYLPEPLQAVIAAWEKL